jgi:cyanophycinase-like exopeptidase
MLCEGYERALGFLPGTAIDQHFSTRNRFGDMTAFMKAHPQFLGIGRHEATAGGSKYSAQLQMPRRTGLAAPWP